MNVRKHIRKQKLIEFLKYDCKYVHFLLSTLLLTKSLWFIQSKRPYKAIDILSKLHRTGWWGSESSVIFVINRFILKSSEMKKVFLSNLIDNVRPLENTKKFFERPDELLEGVCIFVNSATEDTKGVVIVKYSYYFALLFKFYDVKKLSENYHIVLEPSWAGTCDLGILAYATLDEPVFVMAYEARDFKFINKLESNLIPVKLSSNWWVNHNEFVPSDLEKDIDIVIVSGWATFKRHHMIFKAFRELKKRMPDLKASLAGYPHDLHMEDIKKLAEHFEVSENLTFYEWIPPNEVSKLYARAKVNLLWSRFEGLNRSIIEGMFCDTPCIMRDGFNYGQKYTYINNKTGLWANENTLVNSIEWILSNSETFAPRKYVMEHHNCEKATQILEKAINDVSRSRGMKPIINSAVKINELHGMTYLHDGTERDFIQDIAKCKQYLLQ